MTDKWEAQTELPSWEEWESQQAENSDIRPDDELEHGTYQFAVVDISPGVPDKYKEGCPPEEVLPGCERRGITFVVVNSEDPADLGKKLTMWSKVSSHPMSDMYSLFKAAAGGHLDPSTRPRLADLNLAQVRATWGEYRSNFGTKTKLQSFLPVRQTYPIPEWQ